MIELSSSSISSVGHEALLECKFHLISIFYKRARKLNFVEKGLLIIVNNFALDDGNVFGQKLLFWMGVCLDIMKI